MTTLYEHYIELMRVMENDEWHHMPEWTAEWNLYMKLSDRMEMLKGTVEGDQPRTQRIRTEGA